MTKDEAIALLRSGRAGRDTWNRHRESADQRQLFDLTGADFSGLDLASVDLSHVNLNGAVCRHTSFDHATMEGASLVKADLFHADLGMSILNKSRFDQADLTDACFLGATSVGTTFRGANLSHADLRNSNHQNAVFEEAVLEYAIFGSTHLEGADFSRATAYYTHFDEIDLSGARGLDAIVHQGPSSVGLDTLYLSRGQIPAKFLRGCGVPQTFIEYLPSLIQSGNALDFFSCFISYSHKDEAFARTLFDKLRGAGVRVWYAPEDIRGGKKLHEQLHSAIRIHDKLLLVLSEHSMGSEWVKSEIHYARQREVHENRQILFPVRLCGFELIQDWSFFDPDTGKDLAREIREYFIPDFSNWSDEESFNAAFKKLLDSLRS